MKTAALYYHPDIVERSGTPLVGRRAAGTSFLCGYLKHVQTETIHCVADAPSALDEFQSFCAESGWQGDIVSRLMGDPGALSEPGTLLVPGPSLGPYTWARRARDESYAICGLTHTLSTNRIQTELSNILLAPVEPYDAVICTSNAARRVVEHHFDAAEEYIRERFGRRKVKRPMLPVIPLGIETARFARNPSARQALRQRIGLPDDRIVLMTMARLSIAEKMSPGPMFLALEQAARRIGERLTLLLVGWFSDAPSETLYKKMATAMAPSIDVVVVDGKDAGIRRGIWSAADIFTLPVDNIQETFGLAPVEAMAAGLPVICSDWNGFKDTVVEGQTGFRIPTMAPPPGNGAELAARYGAGTDQYTQYLMSISQQTCLDINAYGKAIAMLATDTDLRRRMGQAGQKRAIEMYDWRTVIPQYQALWAEQTRIRLREKPTKTRAGPRNKLSELDPFHIYAHYPTTTLSPDTEISTPIQAGAEEMHHLLALSGAQVMERPIASPEELTRVQNAVHDHGALTSTQLATHVDLPVERVLSLVLWLAKYGLVAINTDAGGGT